MHPAPGSDRRDAVRQSCQRQLPGPCTV